MACNCAPPDTNGEVGLTQYVQIVNEGYQVFNKTTGASVLGPSGISTIWTGFGGVCETAGQGDPVVLYDQLANRWVISQFAGSTVPTDECVAVSRRPYHRLLQPLRFHLGKTFRSYQALRLARRYYMSMNVFNSSATLSSDRSRLPSTGEVNLPATFVAPVPAGPARTAICPPGRFDPAARRRSGDIRGMAGHRRL